MGSGKWQDRNQRWKEHDVIVVDGRAALITQVGGDGTTSDKSTIHYAFVASDGTLEGGHYFRGEYEVPEGTKKIDFAKVRTIVTLPPEWEERAVEFERKKSEAELKKQTEQGEWEPESHPAYGAIQVGRVSGHTALFGSPFKHMHYMTLTIGRAQRYRGLANDRHFGGIRGDLVTVALSEAQWARMVASAGQGEGVPCTLQYIGGKAMEDCPEQMEVERFHEDIERDVKQAMVFMEETMAKAKALLEDKAPTKAKREELVKSLFFAQKKMTDSVPFVAKQLHERMATVVEEGKTEIHAFAQRTLRDTGLLELAEKNKGASSVFELPETKTVPALPASTPKKPGEKP